MENSRREAAFSSHDSSFPWGLAPSVSKMLRIRLVLPVWFLPLNRFFFGWKPTCLAFLSRCESSQMFSNRKLFIVLSSQATNEESQFGSTHFLIALIAKRASSSASRKLVKFFFSSAKHASKYGRKCGPAALTSRLEEPTFSTESANSSHCLGAESDPVDA